MTRTIITPTSITIEIPPAYQLLKYNEDEERDDHGRWTAGDSIGSRTERALQTYKPSTKEKQELATRAEQKIAAWLGGAPTAGNAPVDVVIKSGSKTFGVEVKSVSDNGNNKITMHPESLARKVAWGRSNHATVHTVVVDIKRDAVYHRKGVGSFRLHTLTAVHDSAHLKKLMGVK